MCEHDDGEIRAWIELRKTDDSERPWSAVGFVRGEYHPEFIVQSDKADECLMECGYVLGDVASENDSVLQEEGW